MERIQKIISRSGLLSRRKAEEAILAGRVRVNGAVVRELGSQADPARDEILLDDRKVRVDAPRVVIALHKPPATITTRSDPQGRRTVLDLLPAEFRDLRPVGRLDFESEGLLLLTNDGDLAQRVAHPSNGVSKTYIAWVRGRPSDEALARLAREVALEDGPGRFESVKRLGLSCEPGQCALEVVVSEGRNRFVRRMFSAIGHPVARLQRVRIGGLELGTLPSGQFRKLTGAELLEISPRLSVLPSILTTDD